MVNSRMKSWNILAVPFRHNFYDHRAEVATIAVLTQLSFDNGEPLFGVEYDD